MPIDSDRGVTYNTMLPQLNVLTDALAPISKRLEASAAAVATAWAIAKGTTPIVCMTRPHHIDGLVRASRPTLTRNDIVELEAIADAAGGEHPRLVGARDGGVRYRPGHFSHPNPL